MGEGQALQCLVCHSMVSAPLNTSMAHNKRKESQYNAHQEVENAESEHCERDAYVAVVVEEIEHSDAQAAPPAASKTRHIVVKT